VTLAERDGPSLVVAVGRDGAIGRHGSVPWRAPEDMAHFKRLTMGHVVVFGAATWASIGRTLPGRRILVVSRRELDLPPDVERAATPDAALDRALERDPAPVVGGGAAIYAALLPRVVRVFLTEVDEVVEGADTFWPPLDADRWSEVDGWQGDDRRLTFRVLDAV
jgi:dihydrofolate reductase